MYSQAAFIIMRFIMCLLALCVPSSVVMIARYTQYPRFAMFVRAMMFVKAL
jgi:hypothetical protein